MAKHGRPIQRRTQTATHLAFGLAPIICSAGFASAQSVTGHVINGISGVSVPRALVRINQRAVLTDGLGHFEFQLVTEQNPYLTVSKPGFYASLDDASNGSPVAADLTGTPTTVSLYPEAIITGTVSTRAGEPLQRVRLSLNRMTYDDSGPRLVAAGFATTNTRGDFRFATQPGAYRVNLNYSPAGRERSEAVLPAQFPEPTSSSASNTFRVVSSEVRHLDLHPKTSTVYPVRLQVDGNAEQRLSQITVRTLAGLEFAVIARNDRTSGSEARAMQIDLPAGSYHLHTLSAGSQAVEAEASITVTGQATDGVALHFQPIPSMPIQIQVDTSVADSGTSLNATGSSTLPNPTGFSPSLRRVDGDESSNSGVRIETRPDKTLAVTAPAGTYRLLLRNRGQWYVKSAFYGTTDLLTHSLVIGPGAGGEAIRLLVSANTGKLAGTARINGTPALAWVYLVANGPSAAPVTTLHTQWDGSFVQNYLPPGSYTVLALTQRASVDLTNPEIRASLGVHAPTVQVVEGAEATIDLDVAPDLTVRQGQTP